MSMLKEKEKLTCIPSTILHRTKRKKARLVSCVSTSSSSLNSFYIDSFVERHEITPSSEISLNISHPKQSCIWQHTIWEETTSICNSMPSSLHTLPIDLVYRILDHLDNMTIFWSCQNVCRRLNDVVNTYHPYRVTLTFTFSWMHYTSFCVAQVSSFSTALHKFSDWYCTGGIILRKNRSATCHNEI